MMQFWLMDVLSLKLNVGSVLSVDGSLFAFSIGKPSRSHMSILLSSHHSPYRPTVFKPQSSENPASSARLWSF